MRACLGLPAIHDLQLSQLPLNTFTPLSKPIHVCDIDFSGKASIATVEQFSRKFEAETEGQANAIFFWWDIRMNPSGSILLSCAPHWNHPDTDKLAKSEDEITRRNSIPWRDHWMQGCFFVQRSLNLRAGEPSVVVALHDEFSWCFDVRNLELADLPLNRPFCSCGFHVKNSRNRILQMNDHSKIAHFEAFLNDFGMQSGKCFLFTGDHNIFADFYYKKFDSKAALKGNEKASKISHVIAEPHFNDAVLPWDNFTIFRNFLKNIKISRELSILPAVASIHAVPVHFLNLHKIRWPLKSSCEGFDHQIFDRVVAMASSLADANVEPFMLWEYPCVALGPSSKIFQMDFQDENVESSVKSIIIDNFSETCNGIAFWVEYEFTERWSSSHGPSSQIESGKLVNWRMHDRQGVHLIPSDNVEAGAISAVSIKTHFDSESQQLDMEFTYFYDSEKITE